VTLDTGRHRVSMYICDEVRGKYGLTYHSPSSRQPSLAIHAENKPGRKEASVSALTGRVKPWTKNTDFGQNCRPAPLFTGHGQPDSARYTEQYRDRGKSTIHPT
jgi:hypothetical protein